MHNGVVPLTVPALAFGSTFNGKEAVAGLLQPVVNVYSMVVIPALTAVTTPVVGCTVAIAPIVLLHIPPASPVDIKVGVAPMHSGLDPIIVPAFTLGLTVIVVVALLLQPFPSV